MCLDISLHIVTDNVQKALLVLFQNKAGQAAGCKRGGINSDSIGANLRSDRRRMTVHDKFSMLYVARQKRLSNIQKIIATLTIEGYPRPHPGMAEEIIADDRGRLERFEEIPMMFGKCGREYRLNCLKIAASHGRAHIHSVGM